MGLHVWNIVYPPCNGCRYGDLMIVLCSRGLILYAVGFIQEFKSVEFLHGWSSILERNKKATIELIHQYDTK